MNCDEMWMVQRYLGATLTELLEHSIQLPLVDRECLASPGCPCGEESGWAQLRGFVIRSSTSLEFRANC